MFKLVCLIFIKIFKLRLLGLDEANKLLRSVQSQIPIATEGECKDALKKRKFNVELAVKDLKIQHLTKIVGINDADRAYATLDSCGWDFQRAIDKFFP